MKTVLIINSFSASSKIGASVGSFALERLGIEALVLPTVMVGRHPGWGDPGLAEVSADDLSTMFLAIRAQGTLPKIDAILTGYFRSVRQITAAKAIIEQVRAANSDVVVMVDPVMGDDSRGLYVTEAVAEELARVLVPLADIITPNRWEMERLVDRSIYDDASAIAAAELMPVPGVFMTSGPKNEHWEHFAISSSGQWKLTCAAQQVAPNGTGDLFAALLLGRLLQGLPEKTALEMTASSLQAVLAETRRLKADELAVVSGQDMLLAPRSGLTARPPAVQKKATRWVAGVDGTPGGWIAVLLDVTGQSAPRIYPLLTFWDILNLSEQPQKIAVDMPIGFPEIARPGGRSCEQAARKQLEARRSSVFSAPCRKALIKSSYEAASKANAQSGPDAPKLSRQSYGLFPKMREIDARMTRSMQEKIFETHPELAFTEICEGTPCPHSKKSVEGINERRAALRGIGYLEKFLTSKLPANVSAKEDDFLDACACAWVAQRALLGAITQYPADPEVDTRGLQMVIRV